MDAIGNMLSNATDRSIEMLNRFEPKLKPEIDRVRANPFYPGGRTPRLSVDTTPQEVFESNLPGQTPLESRKIGTVLNTVA